MAECDAAASEARGLNNSGGLIFVGPSFDNYDSRHALAEDVSSVSLHSE
jgi:hypothetical protein